MNAQKVQKDRAAHLELLLAKLEPKMSQLMTATTEETRKKLQKEIITLTQKAGYHEEVLRLKTMFNV